jgi:hypothetical protein
MHYSRCTRVKNIFPTSLLLMCFMTSAIGQSFAAQELGLRDIPMSPEEYHKYLKIVPPPKAPLPTAYDARAYGLVTSAKNQGSCGSSWAFVYAGAFESHLLKEYSFGPVDLSEQQQVSCNFNDYGCCGGNAEAIRYWESVGPIYESACPYAESSTACPAERTVDCSSCQGQELPYRVTNFHTVLASSPEQVKTSVYDEGPSWFALDYYSDFPTYWLDKFCNTPYVQRYGWKYGRFAVLIIGWDDAKNAYLCKNSWGATGGPCGDGTFWIAITGHANDLGFEMANFSLTITTPAGPSVPTLSRWGLGLFTLLLLSMIVWVVYRRKRLAGNPRG